MKAHVTKYRRVHPPTKVHQEAEGRWCTEARAAPGLWPASLSATQASEPPYKTSLLYKSHPNSRALPLTKIDSSACS